MENVHEEEKRKSPKAAERKLFKHFIAAMLAMSAFHGCASIRETQVSPIQQISVERFGLYVVSSDMRRSRDFYEALFERPPQIDTAGLVGFDVDGAFYAIVSKDVYAPDVVKGDSTVPYIKVTDIDATFTHAQDIAPHAVQSSGVISEGPFRFFKIEDPDGSILEFFSVR